MCVYVCGHRTLAHTHTLSLSRTHYTDTHARTHTNTHAHTRTQTHTCGGSERGRRPPHGAELLRLPEILKLHIYIYVYVYIRIYIHSFMCVCVCVCVSECVCVCIHTHSQTIDLPACSRLKFCLSTLAEILKRQCPSKCQYQDPYANTLKRTCPESLLPVSLRERPPNV